MIKLTPENMFNGNRGKLYQLLLDNPDGVHREDILKKLSITKSSLYTMVSHINKYATDFNISNKRERYYLKTNSSKTKIQTIQSAQTTPSISHINKSFIPASLANSLKSLPVNDVHDLLDMYKKSYYYKKSAEALLEANQMIGALLQQLNY